MNIANIFTFESKSEVSRFKTFVFAIGAFILFLAIAEITCAVALRWRQGYWLYSKPKNYNYQLFEPHPQLVGVPRKNVSVTIKGIHYQHNSDGFRGKEFSHTKTKKRIACIGGSTTYCIGVSNSQTYPYYLDSLLEPEYEVLNFGIPGHCTVEHKKLLPEIISKYSPDIVIFQIGLNDLRNMNVSNLTNDYSSLHQPSLFASFGFCLRDRLPRSALLYAVFTILQKIKLIPSCPFPNGFPPGTISDSVDARVVKNFQNNIDTMLTLCFQKNIPVILLPQILSEDIVTETNYKWWVPYLTKKGIFNALVKMNDVVLEKASSDNLSKSYVDLNKGTQWSKEDFFDASHLNAKGNLKLARIVANARPFDRVYTERSRSAQGDSLSSP